VVNMPRGDYGALLYVCCRWMSGDSVSTVEYYDPFAARWQLASSMCTLRSRVGIAVYKGIITASCLNIILLSGVEFKFTKDVHRKRGTTL